MNYTSADAVSSPVKTDECGGDACSMLALLDAARSIQGQVESALEAVGLSAAKYQALDALVQAGQPLALSELAGKLRCVRSNITQLTDRLEADGLVKRVDDPSDRRAIRAVVTPLGAERQKAGAQSIRQLQDSLASRVGPADRETFLKVLAALK
ncbi:MAG: yusO 1 [Conexibacter sp.]|nr:yusO 1 [Conexibacter sp.]